MGVARIRRLFRELVNRADRRDKASLQIVPRGKAVFFQCRNVAPNTGKSDGACGATKGARNLLGDLNHPNVLLCLVVGIGDPKIGLHASIDMDPARGSWGEVLACKF